MSMPKVGGIVILILIGFILNTVSVFTKGWIVVSIKNLLIDASVNIGIVPFNSNNAGWFNAASVMMFISFAAYILLVLAAANVVRVTHEHGCCHSVRHSLNIVTGLVAFITVLILVAFILMVANANGSLGYSAYLALASMIIAFIAGILAAHTFYHDCR